MGRLNDLPAACQARFPKNFSCPSKRMRLLYRDLWGVELSKKTVGFFELRSKVQKICSVRFLSLIGWKCYPLPLSEGERIGLRRI